MAMAMAMAMRPSGNSWNSWSATSVPKSAPVVCVLGLGQVRQLQARRSGLWGNGVAVRSLGMEKGKSGGVGTRRGSGKRGAAQAAFISPPADPQFMKLDEEEVLSSVPVAPRGPKPIVTWGLIAGLLWKQKLRLIVAALALVAATTCTLTMPLFSGKFFETLIGVRKEPLRELLTKLSAVYVMEPALTVLFVTNMIHVWENVMANLRSQVFRRILIQKVEFFDRHKVGELTGILSQDLGAMKDLVNENVSRDRGFRALSEMMGTLVILFVLSSQLAPVLGLLMLAISGTVAIYKRTTMPVFKAHGAVQARIIDTASETFSAIRTVRSFGGERRQTGMFDEMVLAYQKSGDRLGWLKSTNESWTRVAIYISLMALYVLGGAKVKAGELTIGTMVSFIGYTFTLTFAVQGLVNSLADLQGVLAAVTRINSMVWRAEVDEWLAHGLEREARGELQSSDECASSVDTGVVGGRPHEKAAHSLNYGSKKSVCELAWSGDVVLENVFFAYPTRPEALILKGISLQLKRSTVTAVVGSSGAGKSTIVQLLARFYEPSDGRITLAGIDVRKFDKSEWARAISIVNQPRPHVCSHALTVADLLSHLETSLQSVGQNDDTTQRDTSSERVSNAGATSKERVWTGPSQYREERSLNRRIIEAPDAEYVLAVVLEALNKPHWGQPRKIPLSPLNCATALHRIAKRLDEASIRKSEKLMFARRPEMRDLLDAAVKAFPVCSGQGLANIAWALSKIGGSALFTEEMDFLADAAHEKLPEFNAQNLANTVGAFASMTHAAPSLFDAVAERAGTLTETFRPQELVQILWAFACMNHPIDFLFDSLDVLTVEKSEVPAATFRGFSQQQLASMAWSSAVLGQVDRPWFISLWNCINARSVAWTTSERDMRRKGIQHLCQLYLANLALRLECAECGLTTERELEAMINEAWEKEKEASKLSSGDHREVDRLLVGATGRPWVSEYDGAPYSLDLALVDVKVALEIDGRTHFSRNTNTLLGHTVLKQRLLRAAGWTIIPIPFYEWEELRGELERTLYLRRLLHDSI